MSGAVLGALALRGAQWFLAGRVAVPGLRRGDAVRAVAAPGWHRRPVLPAARRLAAAGGAAPGPAGAGPAGRGRPGRGRRGGATEALAGARPSGGRHGGAGGDPAAAATTAPALTGGDVVAAWLRRYVTAGAPSSRCSCCSASTPSTSSTGRVRRPPAGDPRRLRARHPGRAHGRGLVIGLAALRCRCRSPSGRPGHPGPHRQAWAPCGRVFSVMTGLATGIVVLAASPAAVGPGQGGRRPHPQLAARRLLPASRAAPRSSRSTGRPTPSARSSGRWPPACWPTRSAGGSPFLVFAIPTVVFVVLAWRLKEPVGGHERRAAGATTTPSRPRSPRLVRRGVAGRLEGRDPAADLVVAAVPRRRPSSGSSSWPRSSTSRSSTSTSGGFIAAGAEPFQLVGLIFGARIATRLLADGPGRLSVPVPAPRWSPVGLVVFALAPTSIAVASRQRRDLGAPCRSSARHPGLAVPGHPAHVRAVGFSVGVAVGSSPASCRAADGRVDRRHLGDPAGCS